MKKMKKAKRTTMKQQLHQHLKKRKILQMKMEIQSPTIQWGPDDIVLVPIFTSSKKKK
jgi:hypothetical protein